jgi:hypothetical protein
MSCCSEDNDRPCPSSDITDDYVDESNPPTPPISNPRPLPIDFGTHRTTRNIVFAELLGIYSPEQGIAELIEEEAYYARLDAEALDRIHMNDVELPTDSDTEYSPPPIPEGRSSVTNNTTDNNKQKTTVPPVPVFGQASINKGKSTASFEPSASSVGSTCQMAALIPPQGKPPTPAAPPPAESHAKSETTTPAQAAATTVPEHGKDKRPPNAPTKPAARAANSNQAIQAAPAANAQTARTSEEEEVEDTNLDPITTSTVPALGKIKRPPTAPANPAARAAKANQHNDNWREQTTCKFYLRGTCNKGRRCPFNHKPNEYPLPYPPPDNTLPLQVTVEMNEEKPLPPQPSTRPTTTICV